MLFITNSVPSFGADGESESDFLDRKRDRRILPTERLFIFRFPMPSAADFV
jgi:hypothetical protein